MRMWLSLLGLMIWGMTTVEGAMSPADRPIALPSPHASGTMSLEEAMARRRSHRAFGTEALTLEQLSRLLWAAQGISAPGRRTAPSAGALYPLEVYVDIRSVAGMSAGVYRYGPERHDLEPVVDSGVGFDLAPQQAWLRQAAMVAVISARFGPTNARYGSRGDRYVYVEAGHAAQNLLLEATSLGLCAAPVGALDEAWVGRHLKLSKKEAPIYLIPVGSCPRSQEK